MTTPTPKTSSCLPTLSSTPSSSSLRPSPRASLSASSGPTNEASAAPSQSYALRSTWGLTSTQPQNGASTAPRGV